VTRNDIILGVVALVLVAFSLVVSLVVPRRNPGFPGRNLRVFVVVAALLVVAMLAAVEVFGGEHEEGEGSAAESPGAEVFSSVAQPPCSNCHTLAAAGATQTLGPNLDETLQGKDRAFIRESILDPDAEVAQGFPDNLMPEDYGQKLSDQELDELVTFLVESTGGAGP
jgi:mono/diheme cytochrome c family protein